MAKRAAFLPILGFGSVALLTGSDHVWIRLLRCNSLSIAPVQNIRQATNGG